MQALGVDLNLITLLKNKSGSEQLTIQEAMDKIGERAGGCYRRWYRALADMPIWGEDVDRQALQFVECCRNVALGNLSWR